MIVVSDTSPISALLKVGEADLVPKLFRRVVIPHAVAHELQRRHELPQWVEVRGVSASFQNALGSHNLDPGEAEAIALALELSADHLLIASNVADALRLAKISRSSACSESLSSPNRMV